MLLSFLLRYFSYWIAVGFGTGWFFYAPGTFATVTAGFLLYWILQTFLSHLYVILLLFAILFGCIFCHIAENILQESDHPSIVWDEICGYLLTMLFIPFQTNWMIFGCILFRFFDIVKPGIIGYINQRLKGGIGIMLDDLVAGIIANFVMRVSLYVMHH